MKWNHRLVQMNRNQASEPWVQVMETFYNDDGSVAGFTDPCLGSEHPEQIASILRRMLDDLAKNPDVLSAEDCVGFKHEEVL
jgi:hypothetical protein